jgi:Uma2 family endonuclease
MTVDDFLVWAEGQDVHWELYKGIAYARGPERTRYGEVRFAVQIALFQSISKAAVPCRMLPNGPIVRVSQHTTHEPDALVYCGAALPKDAIEVPNPIVVVDVASTRKISTSLKLAGYFSLSSVHHYLIVNPEGTPVLHHSRQADGTILTRIAQDGTLRFDPPGIEIAIADIFTPV